MLAIFLGVATVLYWLCFGVVMLFDLYLSYPAPALGIVVRVLFFIAVLVNMSGVASAFARMIRRSSTVTAGIAGLALNILSTCQRHVFLLMALLWFQDVIPRALIRE